VQSAGIGIGWLWILGLSLLALLGLFLLWRGLRPRRKGTTPYCSKCGYNLTGTDRDAEGARCPECGTYLAEPNAVLFGERHVRPRRVVAGVACLLLGLGALSAILIANARRYDWYRLMPTGLVIQDLRNRNLNTASRAWQEVQRRDAAAPLSAKYRGLLIEVCLEEQTRAARRGLLSQTMLDRLDAYRRAGHLSDAQTTRFFENAVKLVELKARPTVLPGYKCPFHVISQLRMPQDFFAWRTLLSRRLDGKAVGRFGDMSGSSGWGDGGELDSSIALVDVPPGKHELTVEVEIALYQGYVPDNSDAPPIYQRQETLTTTFVLLPEEPPDHIRLTSSPTLDATVAGSVGLRELHLIQSNTEAKPYGEILMGRTPGLPIDLAFEILIESQGQVVGRGSMTASKGNRVYTLSYPHFTPLADLPFEVDVRLVASPDTAMQTVDLFEIWGGELLFENVEVFRLGRFSSSVENTLYKARLIRRE